MTQFWALPQSVTPPLPITGNRRSRRFMWPVGWALNSRICANGAGPTKSLSGPNYGHASMQQPQVMHFENV